MNKFWDIDNFAPEHCGKPNAVLEYYSTDSPKRWNINTERDYVDIKFNYKFNKQGFRSENDFDENYDFGFLIAGDSFVIGEGVPVHDTWAYQLTQKLSQEMGNPLPHLAMGWPGGGSKRICQNIITFINKYKTNRVLAMFPTFLRTTLIDFNGINNFIIVDAMPSDQRFKKIYRSLNTETFLYYFVQDLFMMQYFCQSKNIPFNWMCWDEIGFSEYRKFFPKFLLDTNIDLSDLNNYNYDKIRFKQARDGLHPGKSYQYCLTNKLFDFYKPLIEMKKF